MLLDFLPLVRGRERTLPTFKSFVKGILQVSSLRGVTLTSTDYSERTAHSVDLPSYNHDKFSGRTHKDASPVAYKSIFIDISTPIRIFMVE